MAIQFELTDTFGGEANYSWAKRAYLMNADKLTDRQLIRMAKKWAGLTGARCVVSSYGETIDIRPRGVCWVLFISYTDFVQGSPIE